MRRNKPDESGSLSSAPKDQSRFKARSLGETGRRDTGSTSNVVVGGVLFSRIR